MAKFKYSNEYELRASPKMLFPYLSTASGLSQWFANKVNNLPDHQFDFHWDNEKHHAQQSAMRLNKSIKFEFLDTSPNNQDNNYVEFKIEVSDLTNATFLRITDYSANEDEAELNDLWEGLIHRLKEIVGS
ncbi:MAG: ATPase [Cytophagia bacterium]|nr:MAG: ATPase [Cytophagales bacterium]TAG37264.1 MAG: ATPase [Cytophagia bacterium]